jgi:hypothetical protein
MFAAPPASRTTLSAGYAPSDAPTMSEHCFPKQPQPRMVHAAPRVMNPYVASFRVTQHAMQSPQRQRMPQQYFQSGGVTGNAPGGPPTNTDHLEKYKTELCRGMAETGPALIGRMSNLKADTSLKLTPEVYRGVCAWRMVPLRTQSSGAAMQACYARKEEEVLLVSQFQRVLLRHQMRAPP